MDAYYRKTRRPIANLSGSLKRPPPKSHISSQTTNETNGTTPNETPPVSAKFLQDLYDKDAPPQSPPKTPRRPSRADQTTKHQSPPRPTTPTNARLTRPVLPPPVKRKILPDEVRRKGRPTLTVRELFRSAHPLAESDDESSSNKSVKQKSPTQLGDHILASPRKQARGTETDLNDNKKTTAESLGLKKLTLPATPPATPRKNLDKLERFRQLQRLSPKKQQAQPESPNKITTGPLKGISTSLLDLIRAKEAKAKLSPEELRQRELLGIAPEMARIVPTLFTAHKRDVMSHDFVVDKCYKAMGSNYSALTIVECLELMNKIAPEWVSIVEISRGKFMRLNKDKYTVPQLMEAVKRYKSEKNYC